MSAGQKVRSRPRRSASPVPGPDPAAVFVAEARSEQRHFIGEPHTHDLAADLFVRAFGDEVRWVQDERRWWIASRNSRPGLWSRENREGALLRMRAVCHVLAYDADTGDVVSKQPLTASFARDSLALARARLAARSTDFNADPLLLATPSGVVDLRDGSVRPVKREMLLTLSSRAPYDPRAECPHWLDHLRVLTRVEEDVNAPGDEHLMSYLQELVGVSLIGSQRAHLLIFLHGGGGNGKDVFDGTLRQVLGDYGDVLDQTVLFSRADAHTTGLTDLQGKRYVSVNEVDGRRALNTQLLKRISGGGTIKARRMRQDNVSFTPSHTLWLISNHDPNFGPDESEGLWRRVIVVETGPSIRADQMVDDSRLRTDIEREGPGILNWAVQGAVRYLRRGRLPEMPLRVRAAVEALSESSRLLRRFLDEGYERGQDDRMLLSQLRDDYEVWLREEGELAQFEQVSSRFLGGELRRVGLRVEKSTNNKTFVFGLRRSSRVTEGVDF